MSIAYALLSFASATVIVEHSQERTIRRVLPRGDYVIDDGVKHGIAEIANMNYYRGVHYLDRAPLLEFENGTQVWPPSIVYSEDLSFVAFYSGTAGGDGTWKIEGSEQTVTTDSGLIGISKTTPEKATLHDLGGCTLELTGSYGDEGMFWTGSRLTVTCGDEIVAHVNTT